MNYPDSVRFLYSLGNEIKTAKLGLERMARLVDAMGSPDHSFHAVHVAGTNGKGSTSAMIESAMRQAGKRTGLFTSPHLVEPTERIRIQGEQVSAEDFAAAFDRVHRVAEKLLASNEIDLHPTYFETVTLMAFDLFRDRGVEMAVVECGLGGRLDATNVITPDLTVITPVDFDHEQYLGNTIGLIAREKAGILKSRVPAVFARQNPEAERVLEERAAEIEVPYQRAADCVVEDLEIDARASRFRLGAGEIRCPLAGEHQVDNAVTAALALRALGVSPAGIAHTVWPGRLERVAEKPEVVLDGAHNPAGARVLAAYIARFYQGRRIWMIYGTMRDKAVEEVASTLFPLAYRILATAPAYSRALAPESLRQVWPGDNLQVTANLAEALQIVRIQATPEDAVFVCGSLFLVGEARALFIQ